MKSVSKRYECFWSCNLRKIWQIDMGFKEVSIMENELAVGLGHRKNPEYDKKNFIKEIRALGAEPHKTISYTANPFKAERGYCSITDNYLKLRYFWIFSILFIFRFKMFVLLLEPEAIKSWTYVFTKKFHFLWSLVVTYDEETLLFFKSKSIFFKYCMPNSNAQ